MTTRRAEQAHGENTPDGPTADQVRRGRRTAWLLFALGFGPMLVATIMFYTGWLNPEGHSNQGELIHPPIPVTELSLQGEDATPLAERFHPERDDRSWLLLVVAENCGSDCEKLLYLARQVNIALGKNANRVERAAWLGKVPDDLSGRWDDEYASMERLFRKDDAGTLPAGVSAQRQPEILLVDPLGNVMMKYSNEHTGKQMLKDLKHLLKLSQIG